MPCGVRAVYSSDSDDDDDLKDDELNMGDGQIADKLPRSGHQVCVFVAAALLWVLVAHPLMTPVTVQAMLQMKRALLLVMGKIQDFKQVFGSSSNPAALRDFARTVERFDLDTGEVDLLEWVVVMEPVVEKWRPSKSQSVCLSGGDTNVDLADVCFPVIAHEVFKGTATEEQLRTYSHFHANWRPVLRCVIPPRIFSCFVVISLPCFLLLCLFSVTLLLLTHSTGEQENASCLPS